MEREPWLSRGPSAALRRPLVALVVLIAVLVIGVAAWSVIEDHRRASAAAEQAVNTLVVALREHTERTFGETERVLINLAGVAARMIPADDRQTLAAVTTHIAGGLPQARAVFVTDASGRVIASVGSMELLEVPGVASEVADTPAGQTAVSLPYRAPDGNWLVYIARPVMQGQTVLGYAAAALDPGYFTHFYDALGMGQDALVTIIRQRGEILFRKPEMDQAIGLDVSDRPLFTHYLSEAPRGLYRIRTGTDSVERIQAYATLERFPLVVLVGIATDEAYAAWLRRTLAEGTAAVVGLVVVAVLAVQLARKVTRLERSERHVRAAQRHLSRAQGLARLGSFEWMPEDGTLRVSAELLRICGLASQAQPTLDDLLDMVHPDERAPLVEAFQRLVAEGGGFHLEYRLRLITGEEVHVRHEAAAVTDALGRVRRVECTVQDVTEATALQVHLVQTAKLATLGEMAAGMAHELSQPLNALRLTCEQAVMALDAGPVPPAVSREAFQVIAGQADRMAQIVDHIRIFSRREGGTVQVFDGVQAVRLAVDLMRGQMEAAAVDFDLDVAATVAPITGRPVQFEQVVISLLSNAKDAALEQAALDAEAKRPGARGPSVELTARIDQGAFVVTVRDNGGGLPPAVLERIFEPFFTTKPVGRGAGLGLSVSYGIVEGMGGSLTARNGHGGGAVFQIRLPLETVGAAMMAAEEA